MLNVKIAREHANKINDVKKLLDETLLYNASFCGEDYTIELDDFTYIDSSREDWDCVCLLKAIQEITK